MSDAPQATAAPGGAEGTARPAPVDGAHWRARLAELIAKYKVPAAALGILSGGEIVDVTAGLLSKKTLVEATPDSVFQIGSITKVWTTTLIMQLVDEGKLTLDTPVAQIITDFAVSDPQASKQVTIRHLLTHTSGIDGDVFTDTGRGDDCLEKYVADMDTVAQNHPLGVTFSYCNSGFSLAGRIIEVLSGKTWDAALRERIIEPLGLPATVTLPEEAILHRAAVGHMGDPGDDPQPAPRWMMPRSVGPAGLITARVHDLLEFARMHLAGGVAPDGTRILSEDSAKAMTQHEVDLPDPEVLGDSWGLGWIRFSWDGHRLFGHDGSTVGQNAFMRILPEQEFAVALLTNGGDAAGLYRELYAEIFAELAGVTMPAPFAPPENPPSIDLQPYVGRYSRASVDEVFALRDGRLVLTVTPTGAMTDLNPESHDYELVPVAENRFAARMTGSPNWTPVLFYSIADGTRYVHLGVRATPRVSD
ncbi:MAG: beta-lactamase family protein [Actinomycetota bacterium]|nr:beta-lactamase family protein [Actinomycetota bacterium]